MDLKNMLEEVNLKLKNIYGDNLKKVILYGSYAKNEQNEESDVDIMVLVNDIDSIDRNKNAILDLEVEMSLKYETVLSIFSKNIQEYMIQIYILPFLKNIEKEGRVLYET